MNQADLAVLVRAASFAATRHRDQRRKDEAASPYINHPLALADLLVNEGDVADIDIIVAALLHDTIEDTNTTADEIEQAFGAVVRGIVEEVTDDMSLPRQMRKRIQVEHAPGLSSRARAVKLADKICNLRDVVDSPPAGWPIDRCRDYFDWAKAVIDGLRGEHERLEALFDDVFGRRP